MADISKITIGGTTYDIKDVTARQSSGGDTAASTTYDNSDSGLQATNVQDAIDEIYAQKGAYNGIAELGANGKVPSSQLPSYIDDVLNGYYNNGHFYEDAEYTIEISGSTGYVYYDYVTAKQYRWNGAIFIEIINSGGCSASDVTYSNVSSGLSATNVQTAIDELNTKIYDAGNYETVVLTIGSSDSTFNPVGQTVTVTLEDGSSTDYVLTSSLVISFAVQRGMRYTISGTSTEDYRVLPVSVKAAIPTRYLTMRYIPIATGVFILQNDGTYYLREKYDTETMAEGSVGVLVLTSALINAGFGIILGKGDNYINKDAINKNYRYDNNMTSTTALVGQSNTQLLVTDGDAGAIYVNSLYVEWNDDKQYGYLPSLAEGNIIRANVQEINDAMNLIAGKLIKTDGLYRTSTYKYDNYQNRWYYASGSVNGSNNTFATRPIYKFHLS